MTQPTDPRKGQPAIAGPSGWDGSMTIIPSIDSGTPVALFDCIPGKDAVGIKSASCSNYSAATPTAAAAALAAAAAAASNATAEQHGTAMAAAVSEEDRRPAVAFGDPSFIGIARPIDASDPNLTATWRKDDRGHISILNETGGYAQGQAWKKNASLFLLFLLFPNFLGCVSRACLGKSLRFMASRYRTSQ